MQIKKAIIISVCLVNIIKCFALPEIIQPVMVSDNKDRAVNIREIRDHEFDEVRDLGVKIFTYIYNFTTQEQINDLRKSYDSTISEERNDFNSNYENMISLVATCNNQIIGFLSVNLTDKPNEVYGRVFLVHPTFQKCGIGKKLLKRCRQLLPSSKKVVCMTSKKNERAQQLYAHFGGKKIENPYWSKYLYRNLDVSNYTGYEFDEAALLVFDKK
ncbi:MAG: GNAT family N-acetyltransferase [Candidatus Babeliales bacterium]|nr:GNAT family N-acetyltransferase [Candidatus Babeliales bacterium]